MFLRLFLRIKSVFDRLQRYRRQRNGNMTTDPTDTPQILKVAEGLYVRQEVDNIGWIDMGEYAIVVDALEQPHLEKEVFAAIVETLGDKPVRYVLNTHTHYDHVALNAAFKRRWGAEIVNQRTSEIPAEGRIFAGSRQVQMLHMPGCHTREDCCVWCPDDKVLFVGDIFGWGLIPLTRTLRAESAKVLEDTYARLIALDASTVVPGHGPLCTTAELRRWVEYFHWLGAEIAAACQAGKKDRQIIAEISPPEDMTGWWRLEQWKHKDSVTKMLRAVRRGMLAS